MNIALATLLLLILMACGETNQIKDQKVISNAVEIDSIKHEIDQIPNDLIEYFDKLPGDSIKIEVEDYTYERSFSPSKCLPLSFLPLLSGFIPQTQSESTGAKPIGRIKINDLNHLLIVAQQDDYGPIYYGLTYNQQENKLIHAKKRQLFKVSG